MRMWVLLAMLPLAACGTHGDAGSNGAGVPATGSGTTRNYAVNDFTAIDLRGSDDADVRVGGAFSVRAQGPSDVLDGLVVEKHGDTLRIGRRSGGGINWGGRSIKIFVTMPAIDRASLSGSGDMTIDRVQSASFEGSTSGSGDLSIQRLTADTVNLSIAGSGSITAAGAAGRGSLSIMGSGDIDTDGLTLQRAKVSIAGSGDIKAAVNGEATVSIMGSGDVDLGANATCSVSKMGSGSVTCGK
jgi:hypothetical protein